MIATLPASRPAMLSSKCSVREAERIRDTVVWHQVLAEQPDRAHRLRVREVAPLEREHHVVRPGLQILVEVAAHALGRSDHEARDAARRAAALVALLALVLGERGERRLEIAPLLGRDV